MNAEVVEALRQARALVAQGWTQGIMARDSNGRYVDPEDPRAAAWCLLGAVERAAGGNMELYTLIVLYYLGITSPGEWNDSYGRTQADVLGALDWAVEAASR